MAGRPHTAKRLAARLFLEQINAGKPATCCKKRYAVGLITQLVIRVAKIAAPGKGHFLKT